jgi:enamine deaminase RidA (YjgF/YER057c/UK114 family)
VFTSTIDGTDVPEAFSQLQTALAEQGAGPNGIVGMSAHVADWSLHESVVAAARAASIDITHLRVTPMPLPSGSLVHLQAVASTSATGVFMTGAVGARRRNGVLPADVRDEIASALDEVCEQVSAAGGSPDDLVHFWAFAREGIVADDFTPSWLARFPTEGNRPARKTWMRLPLAFGDERIVFQATAVIGGGRRSNYEVFGVRHREPLPLGARVGPLFMSSGIPGTTPHESDPAGIGPFPATLGEQIDNAFAALDRMMHDQGGTLDNVALLGTILADAADLPALHAAIAARWPVDRRPALQIWPFPPTNVQQRVQLFASAVSEVAFG